MLLARLKLETDRLHQDTENALNLLRDDLSLSEYQQLLCRLYGFYSPWEARAFSIAPNLIAGRAKCPRLASDLVYLGLAPDALLRIEVCDTLPLLDNHARILGSMYVLEGATLGGRILNRHMRLHFGFETGGCDFFSGYGERTGAMWKQFGEVVEGQPSSAHEEIVSSAVATFESIASWITADRVKGTHG